MEATHPISRALLVVVGAALVLAGAAWILLIGQNLLEFDQAGGVFGAVVFAGLPGASAMGIGYFLFRLAAVRYPGSI